MPVVTIDYNGNDRFGTNTQRRLFSQLPFPSVAASDEEKAALIDDDGTKGGDLMLRAQRASTVLCFLTSTIAVVVLMVFVGLSYMQVTRTINAVDNSVGIRDTAISLLNNVNNLMNNTVAMSADAHSIAHDAHAQMSPHVTSFLANLARLTDHPTISVGGLGIQAGG
jgi:hypothetical protein